MSDDHFLSRWSRLKRESKGEKPATPATPAPEPAAVATPAAAEAQPPVPEPLPPVESLTPQSDFTPFMQPGVDATTRREALKTLFQDPRWNVMDGLDVYIDDYSKADPLPDGWLEKMNQYARLSDHLLETDKQQEADKAPGAEAPAKPAAAETDAASPPPAFDTGDGVAPPAPMKESDA